MDQLSKFDLLWSTQRLPKNLLKAMKDHGARIVVAGGFIRSCIANETINDVDVFCPSKTNALELALTLKVHGERMITTDNAYTITGVGLTVQIIHRWTFANPLDIVPSFDFTIARAAIWFDKETLEWQSACDPSFYQDLAGKRLVYCSPIRNEDAGGSMLRVLKFYQRGYRIPLDSLGRVMSRMLSGVSEVNFEKRSTMEKSAWESQIGHVLTGLLREVDPALDPDHIAHLPSSEQTESTEN